jgi:hypothetical protein
MNFEQFFREAERRSLRLGAHNTRTDQAHRLNNEAMFLLPLLSIVVLMLASGRVKPRIDELGQVVGECMERTFIGFAKSQQHIGWSANLRIRTVRALTFLEVARLVEVRNQKLSATSLGKRVLGSALERETNLAYTLRLAARSFQDLVAERQLQLELQ